MQSLSLELALLVVAIFALLVSVIGPRRVYGAISLAGLGAAMAALSQAQAQGDLWSDTGGVLIIVSIASLLVWVSLQIEVQFRKFRQEQG